MKAAGAERGHRMPGGQNDVITAHPTAAGTSFRRPRARRLRAEVLIVLGLSLGQSAVYAIVTLIERYMAKPSIGQQTTTLNPSRSTHQLHRPDVPDPHIVFALVPVALALYLLSSHGAVVEVRRWASTRTDGRWWRDVARLRPRRGHRPARPGPVRRGPRDRPVGARQHLRPSRCVVGRRDPARLRGRGGLLEEVIVVGYLVTRLREMRWSLGRRRLASAVLRGTTTCTRAGRWRSATW